MKASENIEIFNNFCEVISFLDNNSWSYSNKVSRWDFLENLDETAPAHRNILLHWLVYIHDRVKKSKGLWEGAPPNVNILLELYFKDEIKSAKHVEPIVKPQQQPRILSFVNNIFLLIINKKSFI